MEDCLENDPKVCVEGWRAAPDAYARVLDERRGIDPDCGRCLFVFCACCPCNPMSTVASVLAYGCSPVQCGILLCCPWFVGKQ
jgi:hypothetical protein